MFALYFDARNMRDLLYFVARSSLQSFAALYINVAAGVWTPKELDSEYRVEWLSLYKQAAQ